MSGPVDGPMSGWTYEWMMIGPVDGPMSGPVDL